MVSNKNKRLLVTGASGKLGRHVIELLIEAGADKVIATTRNPGKIANLTAGSYSSIEVRKADFDQRPDELAKAFAGVDRMLLVSTDAVDRPGHRHEQQKRAIDGAVRAGVQHIVYTSLSHVKPGSPVLIANDHLQTEQALGASGLGFTALRNNLYTDLLLMSLPTAIRSGKLFAAANDEGAAYVTREDCARAAVAALLDDFDGKRQIEITGPAVVTYGELAALASEFSGKNLVYVPVDEETLVARMVESGLPEPVARLMVSFDSGMKSGLFSPPTDAIKTLTGQDPTSVRAFLQANKGALATVINNN